VRTGVTAGAGGGGGTADADTRDKGSFFAAFVANCPPTIVMGGSNYGGLGSA